MIVEFDLDRDFFDLNQEFRVISEFKDFRENNVDASRIMWGIYLVEDPESKLYKKIRDRQKKINKVEIKNTGEEEDAIDGVNKEKNNNNDNSSQRTKDDEKSQPEDRARQIQIRADKDAEEALEKLKKFQRKFEEENREEKSEDLKKEIEQYKKQQELIEEQRKEALQEDQDRESEEDNSNQD